MKLPPLKVGIPVWDSDGEFLGRVLEIRHQVGSGNIWEVRTEKSPSWLLAHRLLPYDPDPARVMERPVNRMLRG